MSPYVAEIIHSQTTDSATGKVNVEANAMAHAVWGAIAAASGNNSALAGAAGAVSGELLGRWIATEYYPDVKTEELSDEQKSTISALSTLAAGLMGGLSGGSSADAVAGAQAGKNAVENNLLGGSEWLQTEKAGNMVLMYFPVMMLQMVKPASEAKQLIKLMPEHWLPLG